MFCRRDLIASSLALLAPLPAASATVAPLPVPPQGRIGFRLLRNGEAIGSHTLEFAQRGGGLEVAVVIDIAVRFLGVPLYRYSHRGTERWQDGMFAGIESRTDRDGTALRMRAERGSEGLVVEGTAVPRYVAPAGALPTTYWNRAMLNPAIISSEDGRLLDVSIAERGEEQVQLASGGAVAARRYVLRGALPLDLWYDASGQWAHLEFTKDGSTIIYEKV